MSTSYVECYDRGASLRQISRKASSSSVRHPTGRSYGGRQLFYTLWEARVCSSNDDSKCFIPYDALQLARDRNLVRQILEHKDSHVSAADIPRLLDSICSRNRAQGAKSFFRIFAILVLCKNVGCIRKFIDLSIDDSYLPLPTIRWVDGNITTSPHKHSNKHPQIELKTVRAIFQNEDDWDPEVLNNFNMRQWWAISPFLSRQNHEIPHYVLETNDVLPFMSIEPVTRAKIDVEGHDGDRSIDGGALLAKQGGFSDVLRVRVHPSHFDFGNQPYGNASNSFILKRLKSPSLQEFKLEVDALKTYDGGIEKHLIPLLATFEKEESSSKYYLLFPEAKGDLHDFWKAEFSEKIDGSLLKWMAEQCLGITEALSMLHQDQDPHKKEDYPIYGRHGDIKAANILWFCKPGVPGPKGWVLVLSDFGLMRFHRFISRSIQTSRNLKKTITYQAPEFDIAQISRKSDIWALGCTFLEFITCYLKGYDAVNSDFPSERGEYDERLKFDADKFYHTIHSGKWAELKPKVREWIVGLHQNPNCTPYLKEFLEFIENSMLCIERDKRPSAAEVVKTLKIFIDKCQSKSYLCGQPGQSSQRHSERL